MRQQVTHPCQHEIMLRRPADNNVVFDAQLLMLIVRRSTMVIMKSRQPLRRTARDVTCVVVTHRQP